MNAEQIMALLDRPIAYQRPFVSLGCGVTGAVMLSQAMYWTPRASGKGGWFYKTQAEWEAETGLTRFEQEGARKKLRGIGVLLEKRQGIPAKLYFKVDTNKLYDLLLSSMRKSSRLEAEGVAISDDVFPQTITESTTKTTTETTSDISVSKPKKRFTPPSRNEVLDHMLTKHLSFDLAEVESEKFINFYESKGWLVGKAKMKNWKAAASNWVTRFKTEAKTGSNQTKQSHFDYSIDQAKRLFGGQ